MDAATIKTIIELLTAAAALCAAIASLVSAAKSSKAKDEAEEAKGIAQAIRTEISTHVMTSLSTVIRQTQALQQTQNLNIHISPAGTVGQGLAANTPILQPEPETPQRPLGAQPDQPQEEP